MHHAQQALRCVQKAKSWDLHSAVARVGWRAIQGPK